MNTIVITKSAEETQTCAREMAEKIMQPTVITLCGELGAGKTTFVQGFAQGLGLKQKILSPTFMLIREYTLPSQKTPKTFAFFYHADLYRIEKENQLSSLGLEEVIRQNNSIVMIEWAEKMGNLLPRKRIDVQFEYINEDERRISIHNRIH